MHEAENNKFKEEVVSTGRIERETTPRSSRERRRLKWVRLLAYYYMHDNRAERRKPSIAIVRN